MCPLLVAAALAGAALVGSAPARAQSTPATTALPAGGEVVAGQAVITTAGPAAGPTMTIRQGSDRAAIDWQSFDVGQQATVNFVQPGLGSVILNRVPSGQPSQILGRIQANGQVFLTNPNGVYFAPGASVDVGGLVATTHRISVEDFMAGRIRFDRAGATGSVVNAGELRARLGGYVALLAPEVRNEGVVIARMGTVALAAGEAFDLRLEGHNTLAALRVEPATIRSLVENRSVVLAPGGLIVLSARAVDRIHGGVIRHSGRSEATGLEARGGRLVLEASDQLDNSGRLAANGSTDGPAGRVALMVPDLFNHGAIEALGDPANPAGGVIDLIGDRIVQTMTGTLEASGPEQGGSIGIRAGSVRLGGAVVAAAGRDAVLEVDRDAVLVKPMVRGSAILGADLPVKPASSRAGAGADLADVVKKPLPVPGRASAVTTRGGRVAVEATDVVLESARLDVSGATGGQVVIDATRSPGGPGSAGEGVAAPGRISLSGTTEVLARGRRGDGGMVTLRGDEIAIDEASAVLVDGMTGAGTVVREPAAREPVEQAPGSQEPGSQAPGQPGAEVPTSPGHKKP